MLGRVHDHRTDIGLRILGQFGADRAGLGVDGQQPGGIGAERAGDEELIAVGIERQRTAVLAERKAQQLAPGLILAVAHANDVVAGLGIGGLGGADAEIGIGEPFDHVARILGIQRDLAAVQLYPVHVEDARIALVQPDQDLVRMLGMGHQILRAHALERGQVARLLGLLARQRHRVEMPVLIAVLVLHIEDARAVLAPAVVADAAPLVSGDLARLRAAIGALHPDIEHALDGRREPAQMATVWRYPRLGAGWIAEQDLARDQSRQPAASGVRGGGLGCGIRCGISGMTRH